MRACHRCERDHCPDCLAELWGRWLCMVCKEVQVRGLLCGVDPARREPLAPLVWRGMAWMLDGMVTFLVALPLFGLFVGFTVQEATQGAAPSNDLSGALLQLLFNGVVIVFPLLYEGFMLQSRAQTLGKMALRIRVTAADGSPIGRKHAWVRALIRMLVNFCCFLIDIASAFFRPDRAAIHDMAASTTVRRCTAYGGVSCPKCGRALRHESLRTGLQVCPGCAASYEAVRFDPPARVIRGPEPVALAAGDAAPCAKHADNRTVGACRRCGHFLCALCRVEEGGEVWCLSCFGKTLTEGERPSVYRPLPNYVGYAAVCVILAPMVWVVGLGPLVSLLGIYFAVRGLLRPSPNAPAPSGWAFTKAILWNVLFLGLGISAIAAYWAMISSGLEEFTGW